jgi:MinD-like ATPase involved in chromosome partitioning or flagellar assembly
MVTRADAERQVERKIQIEIAYDGPRFDRAAVTGQVVVETDPSCAAAKSIFRLAGSITDEHGRAAKRVKP